MERRSRARVAGVLASLVLHVGVVGLLATVRRAPPMESPTRRMPDVELVWLGEVAPSGGEALDPAESDPDPDPTSAPDTTPAPPKPRPRGKPTPNRDADSEGTQRRAGAGSSLALSGLRGASRPSTSNDRVPAPRVQVPIAPKRSSPRPRAEVPRSPHSDDDPRSLEEAGFRRRKDGSYKLWAANSAVSAKVHPDGRITFRNRAMTFDPELTRDGQLSTKQKRLRFAGLSDGAEQHRSVKADILRKTAALRQQMARSWARKHTRTQLAALGKQLERTWGRTDWPAPRRRNLLFTLWDDCEEASGDAAPEHRSVERTLDHARAEAGEEARTKIVAFIRETIPKGSDDAFTAAELNAMNAHRESRQRFDPY